MKLMRKTVPVTEAEPVPTYEKDQDVWVVGVNAYGVPFMHYGWACTYAVNERGEKIGVNVAFRGTPTNSRGCVNVATYAFGQVYTHKEDAEITVKAMEALRRAQMERELAN